MLMELCDVVVFHIERKQKKDDLISCRLAALPKGWSHMDSFIHSSFEQRKEDDSSFSSPVTSWHPSFNILYLTINLVEMQEPWSKQHKIDFKGAKFSLSNSFAHPLTHAELVKYTQARGDDALLDAYDNHSLEYTPNGGSLDLRREISNLYNDRYNDAGITISPEDNVLVTAGGQVAIQLVAQAIRSQHAIVFTPGYQSVVQSPSWTAGTQVTEICRKPSQNWQIDMEAVRAAIRPETDYMIVNEPHNPSGVIMTRKIQQQLVDLCREHNITILADEVYRLLEHDPSSDRLPAFCQVYERALSIVSMSKPWGACGISLGWCVSPDKALLQAVWNCQYFGTACPARAAELQAIMVLRASDAILANRLEIIRHNKALLQKVIERDYPDLLDWIRPNAGAICFVRFKGPLSSAQLGTLLAQRGISIKPTYCFVGHDAVTSDLEEDLASYFRVGFGERHMPLALDAFVAVMEEFKDEWRTAMQT